MKKSPICLFLQSRIRHACALACMGMLLVCVPAHATDLLDLSTGLKTLLLLNNRDPGPTTIAVVFNPANPASKADADTIKNYIDAGAGIPGGLKLSAQMTSVAQFSVSSGAKVAFLAEGLSANSFEAVSRDAASAGILTLSTDLECVRMDKCVLGLVTKPRVEIYYSPAAAEASHISFASAFLMLVKKAQEKP